MVDNPARIAFINQRLVNRPMDEAEYRHWHDVFFAWEDRLDAGEETDQGRAHWVDSARRDLWAGRITPWQLAAAVRHEFIMHHWDKEHREPRAPGRIDWQTGRLLSDGQE